MRAIFSLLLLSQLCRAATFTVDSTSDAGLSACTAAAGDCSLRGAIAAANATPILDLIAFDIPTDDAGYQATTQHWRIAVGATSLPSIEMPLTLDGYTQAGALANTNSPVQGGLNTVLKIELSPLTPLLGTGFVIAQNAPATVTLRGLAINSFGSQLVINGNSAHRVEGCFFGTNINGSTPAIALGTSSNKGLVIFGSGAHVIGGVLPAARNLISGMTYGVASFFPSDGLQVQGNLIGTNATGTQMIGNFLEGFYAAGSLTNAQIGGADPAARNVIAGSGWSALNFRASGAAVSYLGTRIEGNFLGTDMTGTRAFGNGRDPNASAPRATINFFNGESCQLNIGGPAPGQANLIAFGHDAGIHSRCRGLSSTANRFFNNRGLAIDLSPTDFSDGATANDALDADDGGNRLQNFPDFTVPAGFLPSGGLSTSLQYLVDSTPANASYPITVHFYRGACGGGSEKLMQTDVYTAAQAQNLKTITLNSPDGGNMLPLVATAIDAAGNNSEFSPMIGDAIMRSDLEDILAPLTLGKCLPPN
jgi:CSLREA domain-containing protein